VGCRDLPDAGLLEALVRIPSVTGSEAEAVRFLQGQARADGLRVHSDAAGNFIADAGRGPRLLLFVGHIDTVPGDIPVRVEDGTLWGRGSVDAKAPLAAAYCAARRHKDSRELTIRVVGAIDEEGDSRGAKALDPDLRPEWILVGEPSGVHGLTLGYKGILRGAFSLTLYRAHGAHPGKTAVEDAIAFWHDVSFTYGLEDRFETMQGHLTSLATTSDGLVDKVEGRFHLRLPPGHHPDTVEAEVRRIAERHGVAVERQESMPPALASKRTPLVAAFLGAIRAHGGTPRLLRKTGTADLNLLAERHPGVPIAAYGPGDASLDHTSEERISLDEFAQGVDILDGVLTRLAATPARPQTAQVPQMGRPSAGRRFPAPTPAVSWNPVSAKSGLRGAVRVSTGPAIPGRHWLMADAGPSWPESPEGRRCIHGGAGRRSFHPSLLQALLRLRARTSRWSSCPTRPAPANWTSSAPSPRPRPTATTSSPRPAPAPARP
jgi:LysW-gamma-L-lysine carboxypeptidase